MKKGFSPISKRKYIELHLKNNPSETREGISVAIDEALRNYKNGVQCQCGNSIWVIGSAVAGNSCFTCITGQSIPDKDYEIKEAC